MTITTKGKIMDSCNTNDQDVQTDLVCILSSGSLIISLTSSLGRVNEWQLYFKISSLLI